jgi:hypothetical protein
MYAVAMGGTTLVGLTVGMLLGWSLEGALARSALIGSVGGLLVGVLAYLIVR